MMRTDLPLTTHAGRLFYLLPDPEPPQRFTRSHHVGSSQTQTCVARIRQAAAIFADEAKNEAFPYR